MLSRFFCDVFPQQDTPGLFSGGLLCLRAEIAIGHIKRPAHFLKNDGGQSQTVGLVFLIFRNAHLLGELGEFLIPRFQRGVCGRSFVGAETSNVCVLYCHILNGALLRLPYPPGVFLWLVGVEMIYS